MADFTSSFWSIAIALLTIVSIVALLWFVWVQSHVKTSKNDDGAETSGHIWDEDLQEYNKPMPSWWLNLFYITLVWGIGREVSETLSERLEHLPGALQKKLPLAQKSSVGVGRCLIHRRLFF